jgi:hypothetical protein
VCVKVTRLRGTLVDLGTLAAQPLGGLDASAGKGVAMQHLGRISGGCRTRNRGREVQARYAIDVWERPDGSREARGKLTAPVDFLHDLCCEKNGLVFDLIGRGSARLRATSTAGYGPVADVVVEGPVPDF